MRITYLLEVADQLWGGVKVALDDANWLTRRGHEVTVVSRSGPPTWMQLECAFTQVEISKSQIFKTQRVAALCGSFAKSQKSNRQPA